MSKLSDLKKKTIINGIYLSEKKYSKRLSTSNKQKQEGKNTVNCETRFFK